MHFSDFYTRRNLVALCRLFHAIKEVAPAHMAETWFLAFTSALWRSSRNAYVKTDQRLVNHGHTYWVPDVNGEINVWDYFAKRRAPQVRRGLEYIESEIDGFAEPANEFEELANGKGSHLLLCRSSDDLPIPAGSIDVVITDPPFGSNVQYTELSNIWWIWRGEGIIENAKEAVQTRNAGFPSAKDSDHYEDMLYRIFKECHRVLKPGGWMVLTFHNREIGVWMTMHRAANRAGFQLPTAEEDASRGMLYQPPISVYTTVLHQQPAGAMLGDFILSFKRRERPVLIGDILEDLDAAERGLLKEHVEQLIAYHGGADLNTLMTGLLPFLQERGLLHRLARFNFEAFLSTYFSKRQNKWYTAQQLEGLPPRATPVSDMIPAEILVEQIVFSILHEKKVATLDEILEAVYGMLVNSQRPNAEAVHNVLARLCHEAPIPGQNNRMGFALKVAERERGKVRAGAVEVQRGLYGDDVVVGPQTHNQIIGRIVQRAQFLGYSVHAGETEQRKSRELAAASVPMASNVEFGIPARAFSIIKEIDLLVLKDRTIQAAFEVATTIDTANKAVNDRYRNLLAALNPGFQLRCYLIVKDRDFRRAEQTLYTPANAQDGVVSRVMIIPTSSLLVDRIDALIDPARGL
ncbi:MAG: DNA methyltransferase [Armatimonadota bacterium]